MTGILLQRSKDPYTCAGCGRMAIGMGVHEPKKPLVAWICGPDCYHTTKVLTTMKSNELINCEKIACNVAGREIAEAVMTEVMGVMWDAGVRDLSTATPDQITAALGNLSQAMAEHVETALLTFGASVKQQLQDGECPF